MYENRMIKLEGKLLFVVSAKITLIRRVRLREYETFKILDNGDLILLIDNKN